MDRSTKKFNSRTTMDLRTGISPALDFRTVLGVSSQRLAGRQGSSRVCGWWVQLRQARLSKEGLVAWFPALHPHMLSIAASAELCPCLQDRTGILAGKDLQWAPGRTSGRLDSLSLLITEIQCSGLTGEIFWVPETKRRNDSSLGAYNYDTVSNFRTQGIRLELGYRSLGREKLWGW